MMNKFLMIVIALFSVSLSFAQNNQAKNTLDAVSKKYDGYNTIESTFTYKVIQENAEEISDQGKLYLNKSQNKYKIILPTQELISDGKSVWSVLKEDKEVQVSDADNNAQAIGPNNIFTFYRSGYKYTAKADEQVSGEGKLKVIELSPLNVSSNYAKIKLRVNKNNHIHDVTIYDKSGSKYIYAIKNLYVNDSIDDSNFQFNKSKYPSFEVVDLR